VRKTNRKVSTTPQNLKSSDFTGKGDGSHLDKVVIPYFEPFTHEELLPALYWIWDGFDRALMGMFLVSKTAEDVMSKLHLEGDGIYVGVRRLEWDSESRSILDAFLGKGIEVKKDKFKYNFDGIPVYIYVFDEDLCILNTDTVLYEQENFCLPNTYKQFIERFGDTWK